MKSDKEILDTLAQVAREITDCRKKLFSAWQTIIDLGFDIPGETPMEKYKRFEQKKLEKTQPEKKQPEKFEWAVAYREVPYKNGRQSGTPGGWEFCECFTKGEQPAFKSRKEARNYMRNLNFCRDVMIAAQEIATGKEWSGAYSQHKVICHPVGSWKCWSFAK